MTEYVYIIGNDERVKIGKTKNLNSRFSTIQTSSPMPIELLVSIQCISMSKIEKMLHQVFKSIRYKGEWFYRVGRLASLITMLQAESHPTELNLGIALGRLKEHEQQDKHVVYQHRLRAMHKALLTMGFDVNNPKFHEEQNKFLDILVEDHPAAYKQFFSVTNGDLMQILDVPYQPFPVYEISIAGFPDENLIDKTRPDTRYIA